jgi:mRNA interferase HigB
VRVISKSGLMAMIKGLSKDVQREALAWFKVAQAAKWDSFNAVQEQFKDADLVNGLLVFNIRQNRYRLIVFPVFGRRKLYIKALMTHKEYSREEWKDRWP